MRKPLGQPTRGKTAPNRLRKTDTFLAVAFPAFVRHLPRLYVDLGYGAYPVTSRETLHRLRRLAIDRFFAAWEAAWQHARGRALTPRQRFVAAARGLAERHRYALDRRDILLKRGFLWLGRDWPDR